jgi:hypothetical protein
LDGNSRAPHDGTSVANSRFNNDPFAHFPKIPIADEEASLAEPSKPGQAPASALLKFFTAPLHPAVFLSSASGCPNIPAT